MRSVFSLFQISVQRDSLLSFRYKLRIGVSLLCLILASCADPKIEMPYGENKVADPATFTFSDSERGCDLDITFWFPRERSEGPRLPLLIFAHGLGGLPEEGDWLN